jgi:hypothetical protein
MRDIETTKIANKAIAPIIAHRRKRSGLLSEIALRMTQRTGRTWRLQTLSQWLNHDPAKRHQPSFGAGLLLLEVGRELINGKKRPR